MANLLTPEEKVPVTIEDEVRRSYLDYAMRVARLLAQDQVAICADGCYSAAQALIAAKANLAYVAPAVGPLDDVGTIGMDLVEQVIRIYDNFGYQTQIVVAEAKNPIHVLDAAVMGADVAVLPGAVIEQLFRHPLSAPQVGKPRPSWRRTNGSRRKERPNSGSPK